MVTKTTNEGTKPDVPFPPRHSHCSKPVEYSNKPMCKTVGKVARLGAEKVLWVQIKRENKNVVSFIN